jgi:hypothetical protein
MPAESPRERLPFEPRQTKKKTPKKEPVAAQPVATSSEKPKANRNGVNNSNAIPEEVSKRMIRRMALFSGIPTALGISSFVVSYYIVINEIFELPTVAVLLVSLGFFGLGVLGLSYGVLSTSWDEGRVGSLVGADEFGVNFGRMVQAWKSGRREARSKS